MEKNNKTLNVPNLRFPEFSGEWDNGTLQSVATLSKGTGISKDQLSEEGHPCILYGELYTKYRSEIIDTIISKTDIDPKRLVRSQTNDVIIPCSGESAVDIATARCVKQSDVLLGGDLNIIRLKGEHDGSFFAYQLNGKRKYDIAKVAQGVSVVHLYGEHLKGVKVNYPSAAEQKKISSLLALIDQRIETQKKIIEEYESLIKGIRANIVNHSIHSDWVNLSELIKKGVASLKRGNVIPKFEYSDEFCYPVYSSSVHNNGLMGYYKSFMFDCEIISWSIDGGGHFFYRPRHKFNVTNVCGYIELDISIYNYRFVSEVLSYQHSKMIFDYQSKAHPSVIDTLYYLPLLPLCEQEKYAVLFNAIYNKLETEKYCLKHYDKQKRSLLSKMFI